MSLIFSSEAPPEAERWKRELHAFYLFNKSKHQDQLKIIPSALGTESLDTTIDLPITNTPRCQMELGRRCVMVALEEIGYPEAALAVRTVGKVTVAGVINRKGGIGQVRLVSADIHPSDSRILENAALRDLRTWRFDSGDHDNAVQIVYSFEITASDPLHQAKSSVSFSMPNKVDVRVTPWSVK